MFRKVKSFLMVCMAIITIMGIVTFSLFILEESLQTVMFGTWAAQDAGNWQLVLQGADTNKKINATLKFVTKWFGWIQPFAYIAYKDYTVAMDYYILGLEAKVLKNQPILMEGRKITVEFRPQSSTKADSGLFVHRMGSIHYVSEEAYKKGGFGQLTGILEILDNRLYLRPQSDS